MRVMDDPPVQALLSGELSLNNTAFETASHSQVHHIISGSFRSLSLFLLAFSPLNRTIKHIQTIPAFGPHQYLATNAQKDRVYTTSWALPPSLSSWFVERGEHDWEWDRWRVKHVNTVPITATSSYITLPPPFTHIYSAGGPTGEIHAVDPSTGGFGSKEQQLLFVPEDELEGADKTRVALRYGSHAFEFSSRGYAFIPVLGTNSIETYHLSSSTPGKLNHIKTTISPRPHDGPRHLIVSPDGSKLYVITEHTNFIDVYTISPHGDLNHVQSRSVIPPHLRTSPDLVSSFRGDTLRLTPPTPTNPSPKYLFATTRGATTKTRGWLAVFKLDQSGLIVGGDDVNEDDSLEGGVERWETPTSGGKANAIDIIPQDHLHSHSSPSNDSEESEEGINEEGVWIVLTDDDESVESGAPGVRVLEWKGWGKGGVRVVAEWPEKNGEEMRGGSHAIWLD